MAASAASVLAGAGRWTGLTDDDSANSAFDLGCTLTKKQRVMGFVGCLGVGLFISALSLLMWTKPTSLALLYTLGNLVGLASTGFLIGPMRQLKYAFAKKRVAATVVFILAMIMTLVSALYFRSVLACIFFILVQFAALVWYTLSYIPFGQQALFAAVKKLVSR